MPKTLCFLRCTCLSLLYSLKETQEKPPCQSYSNPLPSRPAFGTALLNSPLPLVLDLHSGTERSGGMGMNPVYVSAQDNGGIEREGGNLVENDI